MPVQFDKIGDVGLGDGAPDRLELPTDRQILEAEAEPYRLHTGLLERAILSSSPRKRGSRVIQRRNLPSWIPAFGGMTRINRFSQEARIARKASCGLLLRLTIGDGGQAGLAAGVVDDLQYALAIGAELHAEFRHDAAVVDHEIA